MNKRFILYGVVALILAMMLSSGDSGSSVSPLQLDLRQTAAFRNECLKDLIEFEQASRVKFSFCDCVIEDFQAKILTNEPLKTAYDTFYSTYSSKTASPRETSRALASGTHESLEISQEKLIILFSNLQLRYNFPDIQKEMKVLADIIDQDWKRALIGCSQVETPMGSNQ